MKRFKVHIFCAIIVVILLMMVRGTYTVDYAEMFSSWKRAAVSALKQRYEQTKSFVGRELVSPVLVKIIKSQEKAILDNPYQNNIATVRVGNELHPDEHAYRINREPIVRSALETLLGRPLDGKKIPVIACIGSGGGYRAMLCTTGSMVAAEKMGLLDATTYIAALSGSTWALGTWMATGWTWADFRIYLEGVVIRNIFQVGPDVAGHIADVFATKLAFNQSVTSVDLFGALLANRLFDGFGEERQNLYLSQQVARLQDGIYPYPIYTATDGSSVVAQDPHWYEFTPHEIGSAAFGVYVPSWAYGREFNAGQSVDFAPEQTLGFHFGTFGSAYAIHFDYIWQSLEDNITNVLLKSMIIKYVTQSIAGKRLFWAEVNNFMKGIPDIPNAYVALDRRDTLKLVDAGLTFNLPYPPVSDERPERKADVLLFLDASAGAIPDELKKVEKYARKRNLKFPVIDYTDLDKKTCAIFKDEKDESVPVVIYMPRISDEKLWQESKMKEEFGQYSNIEGFDLEICTNAGGVCNTFNFEYTEEEARQVMNQAEFNMLVNKDKIVEVLNWVIDRQTPVALPSGAAAPAALLAIPAPVLSE